MKLVFVHGRDQQGKKPNELKKAWLDTLAKGLSAQRLALANTVETAFPFYGDVLDQRVKGLDLPVGDEIRTRGGAIDPEYQQFRGEVIEEIRQRANISSTEVDAEYGNNPKRKGPLNWEWVQAILRVLDRNVPELGSAVVEAFTRDVYVYLKHEDIRAAINKIVSDAITTDKTVVVGHSLGSVVAYDALRKDKRPLNVPLYVTVGSPLGLELIRAKLSPIKFPKPTVKKWLNAFDQRDVIALYPLDQENFDVSPDQIEEFMGVNNSTSNRHGIAGYLDDATISKRILDALN
jgi:pimeloyl-ACP methyl ester carboxylesterase